MTQKAVPAMVECTCDRCGVFTSWKAQPQQTEAYPSPMANGWQRIIRGGWGGDLCPSCIISFGFWMESGKDRPAVSE